MNVQCMRVHINARSAEMPCYTQILYLNLNSFAALQYYHLDLAGIVVTTVAFMYGRMGKPLLMYAHICADSAHLT